MQYITWIQNGTAAWTIKAAGMAADTRVEIGPRPIPVEPLVRPPATVPKPMSSLC